MELIKKTLKIAQLVCTKLNRSQRIYYFSALFWGAALLCYLLTFALLAYASMIAAIGFMFAGVISDLLEVFKRIWNTAIGKSVILLMYGGAANLAYAGSNQIINLLIKYDTAPLTYAINYVALLLVPMFVVASTIIVFGVLFFLGQVYFAFISNTESMKNSECLKTVAPSSIENYPTM